MRKLNNKGFTLVESLLILIAITLIGFVGYYVWHTKNQADSNLTTSSSTVPKRASKQSISKEQKYVQAIQEDGSIKTLAPSAIAETTDQRGVLNALYERCRAAGANYVVVNHKVFNPGGPGLYIQNGGYAIINTSCNDKAATSVDELGGSGASTYLHKTSAYKWVVDAATQSQVMCSDVDHKGYPTALLSQCYESDGQTARKPL
jgi:competence protein ComGC